MHLQIEYGFYLFGNVERLVGELQELLIESQ
ncbi:hypothetical protein MNBD_GAMMA10-1628 [hydrothermal vent metagenome]|uniref:Uncharacterized protein n=1 Tax=hydrothermal vent metagenome TaxID=652676 RepID=A0A3B0XV81_9ZZZZ